MYEFHFTPDDLLRCRFAIAPLFETSLAVRSLHDPVRRSYHLPWRRRVAGHGLDLTPLVAVQPLRGWTPDFLAPTPVGPGARIGDELAAVRAADPRRVRAELLRARDDQDDPRLKAVAGELAADPVRAREVLADTLELAWQVLVAPYWPRLHDLLRADLAHHARLLAESGLGRLVPELDAAFLWRDRTLLIDAPGAEAYELAGTGVVLIPSAFIWPGRAIRGEGADRPALIYPARGIAELWSGPPVPSGALRRLLGGTRALLLADLVIPAATKDLAARHSLSPANVSAHVKVLYEAGLVVGRRYRRRVLYERTALGDALVDGTGGAGKAGQ
ncbi:DUF5937 family protein [Actinocorallia libanotica]|uniref:DUF5937 family protein n=1 Tax=Actinocorallia libanotica TaxID=46162 RepID=A0ABN1RSH1_9ACTN